MTTQTTFSARPFAGDTDLPAILDLVNRCWAEKQYEQMDLEGLRHWFTQPTLDAARDLRLWDDGSGRLMGLAVLGVPLPDESEYFEGRANIFVEPEARGQGLESEMIAWSSGQLQAVGQERGLPVRVFMGAPEHDARERGLLEAHGFAPVRYFFVMHRPLTEPIPEPEFPEGYTLRHMSRDAAEVARWVEMYNLSFIDHWGFHPSTVERRLHRMADPLYKPEYDLIGVAPDGTFAGFCFCFINGTDNAATGRKEGWIGVLGTRRGYRKIGLGRAMLLAGLHLLTREGMDTGALGVDAENPTGALRLYESVGFHVVKTDIAYRKDL
jgi:mycothiol synthase